MKALLEKYILISAEEYLAFQSIAQLKTYAKNETLLQADQAANKLFFLKSGLLRSYRIIDGLDITHHFFDENWFATNYESYLTGVPGDLFLEALTDVVVYEFDKHSMSLFLEKHQKFEKISRVQAEYAYLQMVERAKTLQTKDLKKRYLSLIESKPQLINRVAQKHIASYLGVAPQSLSRIKETLR